MENDEPVGNGPVREEPADAIANLKRCLSQILLYALANRIVVATVLLPLLGAILRLFMIGKERTALSDQEILFFFLSPVGLIALLLVGGFAIGVAFAEQAGMMAIAYGATEGRRVTWFAALTWVVRTLPRILPLGSHLLGRALLLAAPFLAGSGVIFWWLLRHHDINYYLSERPGEFYWAAVLIAACLLPVAILLIGKVTSWVLALPLLLFERLQPVAAIERSIEITSGHRRRIFGRIVAWIAFGTVSSGAFTWIAGVLGRLILPMLSGSLELTAFAIGSIGLLVLVGNFLLNLILAAWFALFVIRLYRDFAQPGALPDEIDASENLGGGSGLMGLPKKRLLAAGAIAFAAAIGVTILICSKIRSSDQAIIIAHRGAAGAAPENTMASVRQALEDGADMVEIDVQETKDGVVVVFHDQDFMKTANNPLKIWDATLSDLESIDIGSWFDPKFASERVPTLEEVLLECKGRATVNIELKYYGHEKELEMAVVEVVERTGMQDEVVIMSLKYDKVAKAKKLRPNWTYGFLSSVSLGDNTQFEVDFLAINKSGARRSFVRNTQASDRELYVWTVNDALTMSSMLSRGVDGLITDEPALARKVIELRAELNPVQRLLLGLGTEVGAFSLPQKTQEEHGL